MDNVVLWFLFHNKIMNCDSWKCSISLSENPNLAADTLEKQEISYLNTCYKANILPKIY